MDPAQRKRLHDDLKGIIRGELLIDDLSLVLYSSDASLFEVEPLAVVLPRDEEDLLALVRYAGEQQVPLVARGAGTSLTGAALGPGLVVDLSVHFRSILTLGTDTVEVQTGVPLRTLSGVLAGIGRRLVLDPDRIDGTVGGLVAGGASGPRAQSLGTIRDHVLSLRAVLDSGDVVNAGRTSRWPTTDTPPGRLEDIVSSTTTLLEQQSNLIRTSRPLVPLDRCGYQLHDVLEGDNLNLARLLVGSEGSLALFTAATLRTLPLPAGRTVVLFGFARLDAALRGARLALSVLEGTPSLLPTACELLDRRLLRLARGEPSATDLVPDGAEAVLLVEFEADGPEQARALADDLIDRLGPRERLAIVAQRARDEIEAERFWQLRRAALPGLSTLRGAAQPVPIIEDVAVPPERLQDYLPRLQDVLRRHETTAAFLIQPGSGHVHMRPFLDLQNPLDGARLWSLADEVYTLVLDLGGTISAQQGTGLARMPWVGRQYGPLAGVHRQLKAIFDPRHLFNPGKIVAGPNHPVTWPLRRRAPATSATGATTLPAYQPQLHWGTTSPLLESQACHGCGECRTEAPNQRMCPIFRAVGGGVGDGTSASSAEAATPRAKANLMRRLLHPDSDPALLPSDAVRAVADLCVNCKMCVRECPSRVQIPKLMLEAKAANVARHGLDRADWALARIESFAWLGSALAPIANAMLANPAARWMLENVFGVSRRRRLPTFAARNFLRLAIQRGWTRKPHSARPRVAYFVDVFANYNDPLIAEAVVAVLHHNGIEVYVPPDQIGCGMAALAHGDVETAREAVQHNLRILADLAREGFPILCSEPTAALMLRHDAVDLLDDPDARLVAAQVVEFTAFLWDLHLQEMLKLDFSPLEISIGHHVPCHVKALGREACAASLLSLIPGTRVGTIDVSCSGMAGTFGFRSDRYELSMAAGRPMLTELARPTHLFGSTECSACRLQMEDGTGKRTLHPAQYLALAYGLMPGLETRLREPIGEWVLQ